MTQGSDETKDLLARLEELSRKHQVLQQDLIRQRVEIQELRETLKEKSGMEKSVTAPEPAKPVVEPTAPVEPVVKEIKTKPPEREKRKLNLEEFIGGNLINKIGILVLIIGVGIGVKYAIDHDWISPTVRIVLGYLVGIGLLGFGFRLKKKYENFSAVLMSGSMAIFYFISYAMHAYYELVPMWLSFGLMTGFTILTVYMAMVYDKQVIAHIGLVGAYTIPFLFLETLDSPGIFLPYVAILNGGILILSLVKNWKSLFYLSFVVTWLIFFTWFILDFDADSHFRLSMIILPVYFITFYLIFLANKILRKDKLMFEDIVIPVVNSFCLFGFGLAVLNGNETGKDLMGTFTLGIAVVHAGAFILLAWRRILDRVLLFFILGLSILFLTLAIPIELESNWRTIAWLIETLVLFTYGRIRKVPFIEKISYALIIVTIWSMIITWISSVGVFRGSDDEFRPFQDFEFLAAGLSTVVFGFIYWLHRNPAYNSHLDRNDQLLKAFKIMLPVILISFVYITLRFEIAECFNQWHARTKVDLSFMNDIPRGYRSGNNDIIQFKSIGLMIYTMAFATALSFLNIGKFKDQDLGIINLILNGLILLAVVSASFGMLGSLRDSYINQTLSEYYPHGIFNILVRYLFLAFIGGMLWASFKYARQPFMKDTFRRPLDIVLYFVLLVLCSTELIQWLDLARSADSYKLELSILWGLYAVLLIILGIWKKKKHLRIMAIILFTGTLAKVFIYDIAHLDTISKTIVLIILGILLLITSYLYIKYRNLLFGEPETETGAQNNVEESK